MGNSYTPASGGGGISQADADVRYAAIAAGLKTATADSGSTASGANADVQIAGLAARIAILGIQVSVIAGACDALQGKLYFGNPGTGVDLGLIIGPGGNVDITTTPRLGLGPQRYTNGYGFSAPYVTSGGSLWVRLTNGAVGDATFRVTLSYVALT